MTGKIIISGETCVDGALFDKRSRGEEVKEVS